MNMVIRYDINKVADQVKASITHESAFTRGPTAHSWVPKINMNYDITCVSPLELVVKEIGDASDIAARIGIPLTPPIVARVSYLEGQDVISVQSLDPGYDQKMSTVASHLESRLAPPGRVLKVCFYAAPEPNRQ